MYRKGMQSRENTQECENLKEIETCVGTPIRDPGGKAVVWVGASLSSDIRESLTAERFAAVLVGCTVHLSLYLPDSWKTVREYEATLREAKLAVHRLYQKKEVRK